MTDTGRIPGEGQPENAGGPLEQPGAPAAGGFTYAPPQPTEPDDQLLMPSAQGAWGDPGQPVPQPVQYAPLQTDPQAAGRPGYGVPAGPEHAVPAAGEQTLGGHESDGHERSGRDSGVHDYSAVRTPSGSTPLTVAPQPAGHHGPDAAYAPGPYGDGGYAGQPEQGVPDGPAAQAVQAVQAHPAGQGGPVGAPATTETPTPRRPLHLGPPVPEQSGAVRSLADRGPSQVPQPAPAPAPAVSEQVVPETQTAPPAPEGPQPANPEPEYLDMPVPDAGPPVAQDPAVLDPTLLPGPQLGALPEASAGWDQPAPGDPVEPPAHELAGPDLAGLPATDYPAPAEPVFQPVPGLPAEPQQAAPAEAGAQDPAAQEPAPAPESADPGAEAQAPEVQAPAPEAQAPQQPDDAQVPAQAAAPAEQLPEQPQPAAVAHDPLTDPLPVPAPAQAPDAAPPGVEQPAEAAAPPPDPGTPAAGTPVAAVAADQPAAAPAGAEPGVQLAEAPAVPQQEEPAPAAQTVPAPRAAEPAAEAPAPEPAAAAVPQQATAEQPAEAEAEPEALPEAAAHVEPEAAAEQPEPAPAPQPAEAADPTEGQAPAAEAPTEEPAPADTPAADTPAADAPPAEPAPAAAEQGPPAPGYSEAEREAVHRAMRERRDVRNGFRADAIPHEVLLRVLEAAHTAPSVGHSQPWDFVIIRSEETRRTMHELAVRQRDAYAKSLPKARAKQFKELKIEAILDTPVNIVVTADPTRGGRHTLGRHTQPQMAPYSSALAVENLWLAARAEGLGVGWVSFFDEREMVRELGLPEHLEVVAYLCIGYVDAFPEEPELVQSGWSKRRPLSWVVHEEAYGRRVLPGAEPHDLLSETLAGIRPLDAKALGESWERQKRMTKPSGALGMLEIISAQLSGLARQCPPPIPEPAAVAVFAGDHGVHAQGVTPWPQEVTAQMVANFLGGGAVCNAFAAQVGAEVCVVDVGVAGPLPATPGLLPRKVRAGTDDFTAGPAMSREEALKAVEVGIETARDLVAAGNRALLTGEMGIANTTVSAALVAVYTGADPAEVTGRGTGISDEMHQHKSEVVRRALELHQVDPADPLGVLAAVGGLEHAALVGLILGGASLRTPVVLDGVSAGAAALVARAMAPEALAACIAGHRSPEPGHVATLKALGLRPLVDLDLRLGEGTGALLALPLVQSAARAMHEVATFDAAGVTEKN